MAGRRSRGFFDPDYRTKEWRDTYFAPSRSAITLSQAAAFLPGIYFIAISIGMYKRTIPMEMPIPLVYIGLFFVMWMAIALILRRLTRRKIFVIEDVEASDSDEPTQQAVKPKKKSSRVDYRSFEHEVAHLLNTLTSYKAVVVGGSGDGGIDIDLFEGSRRIGIVQCKQYAADKALQPGFIRELYACKKQARVEHAFLATTAYFTPESKREAVALEIKLIDGEKLEEMRRAAKKQRRTNVSS